MGRVQAARSTGVAITGAEELQALAASSPTSPGAEAVARFCQAAGELSLVAENGSQQQAQTFLLTALRWSEEAKLSSLTARIAYRLGLISTGGVSLRTVRGAGGLRRSRETLSQQLRAAVATDDSATSCAMLSTTAPTDGRGVALLALDCAARVASKVDDNVTAAIASLRFAKGAADLARSFDEPERLRDLARQRIEAGLAFAGRIDDPSLRSELLARQAAVAIELGVGQPDVERAIESIRAGAEGDAAGLASVAELQARLAIKANRLGQAREAAEAAIFHESRRPLPYRLPLYYLLLSQAEPSRRAEHVAVAYATLQNIRSKVPRFDPLTEESMFSMHMRPVFEAAAAAKLETASDAHGLDEAQQIVEAFREAELQSALGSECLPQRSALQASDLAAGEALLYPLVFDDRLELIFVTSDGSAKSRFVRLPPNRQVSAEVIAPLVERLSVDLNNEDPKWKESARALYQLLIEPVEAHLGEGGSLAIIPDRALRGVPFAALIAADGKYLVEKTAISVAPALAYSQPGARTEADDVSIVAASLQRQVDLAGLTFPALQGTASEAREAAGRGSPGQWLPDFTREQLTDALARHSVDVLHLATHASFNGRSDKAFIVASDGLIPLAELRDMISRNSVRDGLLDLLILSACETAVGDDESSMGLAGAAIGAGSVSAIASLWPVDDVGATALMREFYGNYQSGKSRAQSLREAQLSLLRGEGANADPFVWAAFTLVGAWR